MIKRLEIKDNLIRALAVFISGRVGMKSIKLEMGNEDAKEWAQVRHAANVMGHLSIEETEKHLREILG